MVYNTNKSHYVNVYDYYDFFPPGCRRENLAMFENMVDFSYKSF